MKILFISSTRIGDAVLSTGILTHLQKTYDQARFTIVCGRLPAPLFKEFPNLEKLIVLEEKRSLKRWYNLWRACRGERWDMVVDLRGSALAFLLMARKRFVWRKNDSLNHRTEQLAAMMRLDIVPSPHIAMSEERERMAARAYDFTSNPVIALAPAANWVGKEWPCENFVALVTALKKKIPQFRSAKIALFASPGERDQIKPLYEALPFDDIIDCVGAHDLLTTSALLKQCTLFIGNDSGLMHMAAAVGTPTVGLFGPSRDEHYAPMGKSTCFIRTPESYETLMERHGAGEQGSLMRSLRVDDVVEAVSCFVQENAIKKVKQ
jgi:heptosyltransferase III